MLIAWVKYLFSPKLPYIRPNAKLDAKMILAGIRHGAKAFTDIAARYPDKYPNVKSVLARIAWIERQPQSYRDKIQHWVNKYSKMKVLEWTKK